MTQPIYLCRHAEYDNPISQKLTGIGILEAKALGRFLARQVSNPIFITSSHERTLRTAGIVADVLGVRLAKDNLYSFDDLCETRVRELEQMCDERITSEKLKEFPSTEDVAKIMTARFQEVGDSHPVKPLVAILHGNINAAFLYEGHNKEACWFEYQMSYCDAWRMEREGAKIIPMAHTPNIEMDPSAPRPGPDSKIRRLG